MKSLVLIIFFFTVQFSSAFIFAQTEDFIRGKVINSDTHEPVPFATILLRNNQLGVYANAEGDFKILKNVTHENDSVIITCIGYKRYSTALRLFRDNAENTVTLVPVIYGLGEVKVIASGKKIGSIAIISRAIKKIPANYSMKPFSHVSYYRDYQKKDGKYLNLNEAIIQTLDKGFGMASMFNSYRLLDFKKNPDFPRINISHSYATNESESKDSLTKSIPEAIIGDQYGNELLVLMTHDAIRNFKSRSFSFIEVLSEDFIRNHNFSGPVAVYNNNRMLYKISFNGKTKVIGNSLLISGAVYIEPKSYSIHKIEYSCSYLAGGVKMGEMFNADIEYGRENAVDSLMCLKYISFNNFFKVVNMDDDTYFRVLRAYWEGQLYINPTMVVTFNNPIDPVTGSKKENYIVMAGNKPLKITSVQVRDKTLFIRTKEEYLDKKADSTTLSVHNVKDIFGNIIEVRKTMDLFQYRELFVQEYNKPLSLKDSCLIDYKPLEENCRSSYNGNGKYWMNTPVNVKISEE